MGNCVLASCGNSIKMIWNYTKHDLHFNWWMFVSVDYTQPLPKMKQNHSNNKKSYSTGFFPTTSEWKMPLVTTHSLEHIKT